MTEIFAQPRRKTIKFWRLCIIVVPLIFIVAVLFVMTLISDSNALVEETASIDAGNVVKVKNIAKKVYFDLVVSGPVKRSKISLSEDEINGIIALVARGIPGFKGRVNVSSVGIRAAFSFSTPWNPFGRYINLTGLIAPSSQGLSVNYVSIGDADFSGEWIIRVAKIVLNLVLSGEDTGAKLINAIESVQVRGSKLYLVYHSVPGLKKVIKSAKGRVKNIRDELILLASPEDVKRYYQNICKFHRQVDGFGNVSLAYYLSDTFAYAEKRSLTNKQAKEENKAALLALAIFLGSADFDSLIGAIDNNTFQQCRLKNSSKIVLENRNDLRLHFIFSAALKIISDSKISFAIGEFKELLDTQKRGSGFSFTDLAADRAGIRFAEFALSETGAIRLQRLAAELTQEKVFFPSLASLPDGVSQVVLEKRGGIDGDYYKKHLAIINDRINALSLYATTD